MATEESSIRYKTGAVIVAGGLSSRMKDFKPLLPVGNSTMIENVIKNFQSLGIDNIVVVTGYKSDEIEKKLSSYHVTFLKNEQFEKTQMFDSVCLGLKSLAQEVDMAFISPADSPFVQQFTLKKMIEEMENGKCYLIQPSFNGSNGHPLLLKNEAISQVLKHDGAMGLQGVISKMGSDFLNMPFVDPGLILDADTTYDYLKLIEYNLHRNCPSLDLCLKIQDFFHMPDDVKAHSNKVASVAVEINSLLFKKGIKLNTDFILASCMLHDIEKGMPLHAKAGAEILYDMGYEEISKIVKVHMELESISKIPTEIEVVFLADKMVKGEKAITIEEKFAAKEEMYKNDIATLQSIKYKKKQALELYNLIFNNQ